MPSDVELYARTYTTLLRSRGETKLKILEPLRGKIPEEVFTTAYQPPVTDGSVVL